MESSDYQRAAYQFVKLKEAVLRVPQGNVGDVLNNCIYPSDGTPISVVRSFDALDSALQGMEKYTPSELEYLADHGFNTVGHIVGLLGKNSRGYYEGKAEQLKFVCRDTQRFKKLITSRYGGDVAEMFARILGAYAEINEYERKLQPEEIQKVTALRTVLESKEKVK